MRNLLMIVLLTSGCLCSAQNNVAKDFSTVKVADGVYAFITPESKTPMVNGNCVAVIGDNGVLVVDTGQFHSVTDRMIEEIKKLTAQPVRLLVTTHWHGDHNLAAVEYRKAFPGVVFVSHPETRRYMAKYAPYMDALPKEMPKMLAEFKQTLASGKRKNGQALTANQKRYIQAEIADLESAMPDIQKAKQDLPDMTVGNEAKFYLGKREVQLLHLGRGNTAGDLMVYVPDVKVLMTGDVVVAPTPYSFGSYPGEWIQVFDKLIAMDTAAIVPGHGPVMHDKDYIRTLKRLVETTRTQVQAAVKQGLSLEETRKRVDLASFRTQLAGDNYFRQRAFDDFYAQPAVEQAYKEAKGEKWEE